MKIRILSILLILSNILTCVNAYADEVKTDYPHLPVADVVDYIYKFDVGEFVKDEATISDKVDPDSERIGFLNSLGLWDDVEKSKSAFLTIKEFNSIMSEVSTSYQPISGEGNVNYGNVVESLLKELGYYSKCALYSDKEKAMIDIASEIGLIKNDAKSNSSFVTRAEFAGLLDRAITIDICVMKYENGSYEWIVKEGETVLSSMHDIHDVSGFVNAIPGLSAYGDANVKEGCMEINRLVVNAQGIDCTKYIGKLVKAYAELDESKGEYKLIYIGNHEKGNFVEIDFKDIEDVNNNYISYKDSQGNIKKEKIQEYKSVVENGKMLNSISDMSDFEKNEGKIVLSASTKNGDYDVAMIYTYNYYVVKYNDLFQNRIGLEFGQKFKGQDYIQIDEYGINHIMINGVISDYTEITAGNTIRIFKNENTGYTEICAVTVKQSGEISSIYDDYVVMSDKKYRMSADLKNIIAETEGNTNLAYEKRITKPKINTHITAYLFGDVLVGYKLGDEYIYAYLKSAKLMETESDEVMTLRVYTQNMEWHDLTLAEKLTLDGEKVSKDVATETIQLNKKMIVSNLVRIKTNNAGKVVDLDTMIETEKEKETTDDIAYVPDYENGTTVYQHIWNNWTLRNTRYMYMDNTFVFVVPEDDSREDKYKIVGPTAFAQDKQYKITMYSPDKFLHLPVVVYRGDLAISNDDRTKWLYVTKINSIINDEDELEYEVVGMYCYPNYSVETAYCKEEKFVISADDYNAAVKAGNGFTVKDLIRIAHIGNKLQSWVVETAVKNGKIALAQGHYSLGTINGNKFYLSVGVIEDIDLGSKKLVRLNCGDGNIQVWSTRSRLIIDLKNNDAMGAELSYFHEGDLVCVFGNDNSGGLMVKSIE